MNFRNNSSKCTFNNSGYCKYSDSYRKQHAVEKCKESNCDQDNNVQEDILENAIEEKAVNS